ncbi:late blight resistance homolog R1A-3 isoform X1 [Olea europaea subsp. europaea]|uniref:Late blight resistance homolog R1A-3 isoform X1 n=1 Tax=Olea europaea subsp. europaea TaxID=158383 RepID=A0A8S0UT44_OLEEU|nr:late blight resistance homolog R1A-3 isoform X1 [Olea europaea subsp. europaea]
MPSDMAPKTGVVSLFIIDSVLDDLMDLTNNKSNSTVVANDQIVTLHEELMLLGSSITDIVLQHEAKHEELVTRSRDIAYEVEYVINSFPRVWYLSLRLPQLIDKIRLIVMAVKEMKNNIDVARMSNVSKHPHEHIESQSKEPPILEDIVVGFGNVAIEIAEQLVGGTCQLQVISIFGMSGLDDGIGSRILFTTRNKEVSLKASPRSVINELPFLSEVECWEILQGKVFQDRKCPQELVDIGKLIAKNCHGLPLAVVVISGVLANMEKKKHLWKKIAKNLSSHISEIPEKCIQTLQLSYNHLPMHLKPCFLYLGAFREDTNIPVRKLISLWVAERFIKKEEHKNIEDVAREYLMKLIDRSLVLVAERRYDGGVKTCKIHDLLREMCLSIAEENNFLKLIKVNDDDEQRLFSQVSTYQRHHRLSINCAKYPSSLPVGLHVRSLLFDLDFMSSIKLISCSYKVLRVFCGWSLYDFLIGFEYLVHLRYLEISCTLPPMENFRKLEFLVVYNDDEIEIPKILLNMVSLRHMEFNGGAYFSESSRQLATNSKSFQINNLQSISALSIYDEMDEKILRSSPNLRRVQVSIENLLNCSFNFLYQLESLKLSTEYNTLYWRSSLISLPLNLKKLTLVCVYLSRKQMEIIARLPCLEVLKLVSAAFEGEQWDTSESEFPQLKYLKLCGVKIAEWNASSDNFPRLQRIVLEYCENLKMIPSNLGDIPTLQKIELFMCGQTANESAKKFEEEQKEMGNEKFEVTISNTFDDIEAILSPISPQEMKEFYRSEIQKKSILGD